MTLARIYTWTVRGSGDFPIDMLRYDQCWPQSEVGSAVIHGSFRSRGLRLRTVNLSSLKRVPTTGRWKSFGWEVI
jgi:hypothetical protein